MTSAHRTTLSSPARAANLAAVTSQGHMATRHSATPRPAPVCANRTLKANAVESKYLFVYKITSISDLATASILRRDLVTVFDCIDDKASLNRCESHVCPV